MKRAALGLVLALVVGTGAPAAGTGRIYEDDPRWDCRTMGNRTCAAQVADPVTGAPIPVLVKYRDGKPWRVIVRH